MLCGVDGYQERAWLDWWANPSMCLGSIEVAVVISAAEAGWDAVGHLVNDDDLDGFEFLRDLGPVFSLRFSDESTISVTVNPADDRTRFTLTEWVGLSPGSCGGEA
jgi:hypothetical protein